MLQETLFCWRATYIRTFFITWGWKYPKFKNMLRTYPTRDWGKAKNFYFGYCTKWRKYFVSRLIFVSATTLIVSCMYNFVLNRFFYYISFLPARVADNSVTKRIHASGWFERMENNNCTPNTYLLLAECEVRTASYGLSFFLPFMAQARGARAMKTRKKKTRIHDLPYGPSKRG